MPIINVTLSEQIQSFMDERHYDPNEIDSLSLGATTNGEVTWYVDGTNGNDSYDGLYPDNSTGGLHGPFRSWNAPNYGNSGNHRGGERVLFRTGTYKIPFGSEIQMALTGTVDDNHYFIFGPYGDGEVVFDFSSNDYLNTFSVLTGTIYKATFINPGVIFSPKNIILDQTMRNAREANGRYGSDNSGVNDKTTSMVDTRRNFTVNPCEFANVPMNAVGAIIYNITDRSYGIVTSISTTTNTNDTLNFSGGLTGGTNNKFNSNDAYVLVHLDDNGDWFYISHKTVFKDNSGVNNKTTYTVDTTKNFSGYEGGLVWHGPAYGLITSISTTTNTNDTINFAKGMNGDQVYAVINNNEGQYQWQTLYCEKKVIGSDVTGTATGYYQFAENSLTDTTKNFSGLEGAFIINETTGAFSRIQYVRTKTNPNDSIVCFDNFRGGTPQYTSAGNVYRIYRTESTNNFLLMKSTSGTPESRNIKVIHNADAKGITCYSHHIKFYGITFICSPGIGVWFVGKYGRLEKCRLMWCGKHGSQAGFVEVGNYEFNKVFVYQNVMNNWPRGNTYGANGGWPQSIQMNPGGTDKFYNGCIIYDNGGEGVGAADIFENGIVVDNYSQSIYFEHPNMIIRNNVVGLFYYNETTDWLSRFYYEDSYNFVSRNRQKCHIGGITLAAENSGPHEQITGVKIYNNIIIGCSTGITQYYEWGPNGMTNSFIANNTIILPSDHVEPLFDLYAGIAINPSIVDASSFIKNNIIIGAITGVSGGAFGEAERMNLCRARDNGISTANINWDKNLYSYPGESTPFTRTNNNINPRTFSQWKSDTGWDANTTMTDTPGLVGSNTQWLTIANIYKKHIKLLSTSVGVDTGEDLSAYFTTDFDGNTRPFGAAWDKGAIEYRPTDEDFTKESVTSLGATDANLATEFIPVEYDYLDAIDNRPAQVTATNKYGVFLLKTRSSVGQPPLSIKWVGKTNIPGTSSAIVLQIYNRNLTTWETLTSNNTVAANIQFTMTATVGNNLSNYYDSNNIVACRVYQQATAV